MTLTQPLRERRRRYIDLWMASFIGLYFEMLVVRWLAAEVRLFSYFKNLTIMAAFMGLGIGFALVRRRTEYWRWFVPLLLLYVPIVMAVSYVTGFRAIIVPETGEAIWRVAPLPALISTPLFALMLLLFFLHSMLLFLPVGQLTGRLMMGLPPLSAYMVNILGSLAGIWTFSGVSYLRLPPWTWFGLGLLLTLWFMWKSRSMLALTLIGGAIVVVGLALIQGDTLWSPYYRLDIVPLQVEGKTVVKPEETGYSLYANQVGHMEAVNLSPGYAEAHPDYAPVLRSYSMLYDLPYALKHPEKVLIVGAGMGNDVAAAIRHETQQIDAVEIDPLIYELGVRLHPERPYQSPSVNVIIDDARSYMEKTDQRYDLIVFGVLDSQTLLSGMSNVRLDNFVYTVESLRQARELLAQDGIMVLTFDVERWWIKQRLAQSLLEVFGQPPIQLAVTGKPWTIYISGYRALDGEMTSLCEEVGCTVESPLSFDPVPVATDDWPYLYLVRRGIPAQYWVMLLVVIGVAWFSTRRAFPEAQRVDWHFFLLGGAFMLIEFKSITELALLFGSTWIVNAIAISAVLTMVLLANFMVTKLWKVNVPLFYALLFLTLALDYVIPLKLLFPYGGMIRAVASGFLMGLPLFFASTIFATSLKETREITVAFGSNFFGSVVGGMIEYGSMAFGIRSLYLFGAVFYTISWLTRPRHQ